MDNLTREKRRKVMRAIRSKNTGIEVTLRKALWQRGIRYRKDFKVCSCKVDIAITRYKVAVFCDGDFWHGKNFIPGKVTTNTDFWDEKIRRNQERDLENTIAIRDSGWSVLRFWGSDIEKQLERCVEVVLDEVARSEEAILRKKKGRATH